MWTDTKIEKLLKEGLDGLSASVLNHDKFYNQYMQVRQYMCANIYPNIARTEPDLTDHGENHIQNVLFNAYSLIKYSLNDDNKYSALDLYVLCSAILIHDIGNLHGRDGHEKTLANIYNTNAIFSGIDSSEKRIISRVATTHGGEENAISGLSGSEHISGEKIQNKCIAGVLRFADELAEGPQRTSQYILNNDMISTKSRVYHQYASISEMPVISQDTIVLKYNIYLSKFSEDELLKLLLLLYSRIYKLNRERINCGTYSKHIQRVKKVSVTINFYKGDEDIDEIKIDNKNLIVFELNNLDCNRIEKCKAKEKYTDILMSELKQFCKK